MSENSVVVVAQETAVTVVEERVKVVTIGIQGPKGANGADGLQGPSGSAGAPGPQGPQGPSGSLIHGGDPYVVPHFDASGSFSTDNFGFTFDDASGIVSVPVLNIQTLSIPVNSTKPLIIGTDNIVDALNPVDFRTLISGAGTQVENFFTSKQHVSASMEAQEVITTSLTAPTGQPLTLEGDNGVSLNSKDFLSIPDTVLNQKATATLYAATLGQGGSVYHLAGDWFNFGTSTIHKGTSILTEGGLDSRHGNIIMTVHPSASVQIPTGRLEISHLLIPTGAVAGYVWTTDENGLGSWQPASGSSGSGLPSQTGHSGSVLSTDGVSALWSNAYATLGSNVFTGTESIFGKLYVSSTLTVTGSVSVLNGIGVRGSATFSTAANDGLAAIGARAGSFSFWTLPTSNTAGYLYAASNGDMSIVSSIDATTLQGFAASAFVLDSAYTPVSSSIAAHINDTSIHFTSGSIPHNDLAAKQGGTAGQYYHLTLAQVNALHDAVTIGSPANGLSIVGQVISIATASVSATGALSSANWSTFNGKQDALGFTPVNVTAYQTFSSSVASHVNDSTIHFTSGSIKHNDLQNLSYSTSGHSGFAGTGVSNTFTADQVVSASVDVTKHFTAGIANLVDNTNIQTNTLLANTFIVSGSSGRTFMPPTGSLDGQKVTWRMRNTSTGSITHVLATGSAGSFRFGTDLTASFLTIAASKTAYMGAIFNARDVRWDVIAWNGGF